MSHIRAITLALLSTLLWGCALSPSSTEVGLSSITTQDLMATVNRLTAPDLTGRLPGTKGYDLAAAYMADQFRAAGLKPGGEDGYFQHLPIEANEILAPCRLELTAPDRKGVSFKLGRDFICRGFTGGATISGPLVFVGYGLSLPFYDDYAGVDVQGKIVIAFKGAPSWKIPGKKWSRAFMPRHKANTAAAKGALAILLVSHPKRGPRGRIIGSVMHGPGKHRADLPVVHIGPGPADDFFNGSGQTLAQATAAIDKKKVPASFPLTTRAMLEVHTRYTEKADTVNVVGVLPGKISNEYLVLGAHLDHVGAQGEEIYFPGANDNASGCAALLAVARAFGRAGIKPRRTLIFVLFSGEEQGLCGAEYYVKNPTVPRSEIVAMFNADCIACGKKIQIGSGGKCPRLWAIARQLDREHTKSMVEKTWAGGGADATPFFKASIPTLYFVTTESYDHLHRPSDLPATLNGPLFTKLTKLLFLTTNAVANGDYRNELGSN